MTLANSLMFDIMAKDLYLDQLHHVFDESVHLGSLQSSSLTLTSTSRDLHDCNLLVIKMNNVDGN